MNEEISKGKIFLVDKLSLEEMINERISEFEQANINNANSYWRREIETLEWVKRLLNESSFKEISALEEKITKEIEEWLDRLYKDDGIIPSKHRQIHEVFQKLRESV